MATKTDQNILTPQIAISYPSESYVREVRKGVGRSSVSGLSSVAYTDVYLDMSRIEVREMSEKKEVMDFILKGRTCCDMLDIKELCLI